MREFHVFGFDVAVEYIIYCGLKVGFPTYNTSDVSGFGKESDNVNGGCGITHFCFLIGFFGLFVFLGGLGKNNCGSSKPE